MNNPHPCIWFDGTAKEAADFYCSLFGNSKVVSSSPMVVMFELNGSKFMGLNGGTHFKINPSISLFVICPTVDETNALWEKLIEGGSTMMPIDKYPWSERYGWLIDKFGLTWQVSVANETGSHQKITPSFLFTGNVFGKAEDAIRFYTSLFDESSIDLLLHYPDADPNAGKVLYSEFRLNKNNFIAMDGPGNHNFNFNEAVSIVVECSTQDEIDFYWNKLTKGGQESRCGWLKDKFGVSWQIVPSILEDLMRDSEKADRVMQAILTMNKLDIEKLKNA